MGALAKSGRACRVPWNPESGWTHTFIINDITCLRQDTWRTREDASKAMKAFVEEINK